MPYDVEKYSLKPVYEYLRAVSEFQDISTRGEQPVEMPANGTALGKAEVKTIKFFC
jgi:hypothetical protein